MLLYSKELGAHAGAVAEQWEFAIPAVVEFFQVGKMFVKKMLRLARHGGGAGTFLHRRAPRDFAPGRGRSPGCHPGGIAGIPGGPAAPDA